MELYHVVKLCTTPTVRYNPEPAIKEVLGDVSAAMIYVKAYLKQWTS